MSVIIPRCTSCIHFIGERGKQCYCIAYPDGIPNDVLWDAKATEKDKCNGKQYYEEDR